MVAQAKKKYTSDVHYIVITIIYLLLRDNKKNA